MTFRLTLSLAQVSAEDFLEDGDADMSHLSLADLRDLVGTVRHVLREDPLSGSPRKPALVREAQRLVPLYASTL